MNVSETNAGQSGLETTSKPRVLAALGIFTALYVVLDLLRIDLPQPLDYMSFAPVFILTFGILLRPAWALLMCAPGAVIGQLIVALLKGETIYLVAYLPGIFVARGIEALLISLLEYFLVRNRPRVEALASKNILPEEIIFMIIGCAWEVAGYIIVGVPYWAIAWGIDPMTSILWYMPVFINLVMVIPTIAVIVAIRRVFQVRYLDNLLFRDRP